MSEEEREDFKKEQAGELAVYITQLTDYLANGKIGVKDMGVVREFMDPLKLATEGDAEGEFGKAAELYEECCRSDEFWSQLQKNHDILKSKYPYNGGQRQEVIEELLQVQKQIEDKYESLLIKENEENK